MRRAELTDNTGRSSTVASRENSRNPGFLTMEEICLGEVAAKAVGWLVARTRQGSRRPMTSAYIK